MVEPLKETCPACNGKGVIPHDRRKMENGVPDPADFKRLSLCDKCGGSGKILVNPRDIKETGNIADKVGQTNGTSS